MYTSIRKWSISAPATALGHTTRVIPRRNIQIPSHSMDTAAVSPSRTNDICDAVSYRWSHDQGWTTCRPTGACVSSVPR